MQTDHANCQEKLAPSGSPGREQLICSGFPPSEVDRVRGVRIVVALDDDIVTTVEHMLARRAWA
jgi:hypothetical protein